MSTAEPLRAAIDTYAKALESADAASVDGLMDLCGETVEFRDPFNHTFTKPAFRHILEHMFKTVQGLKFEVHNIIGSDRLWVLKWTFTGTIKPVGKVEIVGLTEVALNEQGHVIRHIDYWDSGTEIFSKMPVLGPVIRLIRSRASA
ncbi:MAG: nuclear transport factor 2 family protein [Pseudomonadota bacterium]